MRNVKFPDGHYTYRLEQRDNMPVIIETDVAMGLEYPPQPARPSEMSFWLEIETLRAQVDVLLEWAKDNRRLLKYLADEGKPMPNILDVLLNPGGVKEDA